MLSISHFYKSLVLSVGFFVVSGSWYTAEAKGPTPTTRKAATSRAVKRKPAVKPFLQKKIRLLDVSKDKDRRQVWNWIRELRSPVPSVQKNAVRQLQRQGERVYYPMVAAMLQGNNDVRKHVLMWFFRLGKPARTAILFAVESKYYYYRTAGIRKKMHNYRVVSDFVAEMFRRMLPLEFRSDVKKRIIYILGSMGPKETANTIHFFAKVLKDPSHKRFRKAILKATAKMVGTFPSLAIPAFAKAMESTSEETAGYAARTLGKFKKLPKKVIERALKIYQKAKTPELKAQLLYVLQKHSDKKWVLAFLLKALKSGSWPSKDTSSQLLRKLGKDAVPGLTTLYQDPGVQEFALRILVKIGKPAAPILMQLYQKANFAGKISILSALPPMKLSALALLREGYHSLSGDVRRASIFSLASLKKGGWRLLVRALKDTNPMVRTAACSGLAKRTHRSKEVIRLLSSLLGDRFWPVQDCAMTLMRKYHKQVPALLPRVVYRLTSHKQPMVRTSSWRTLLRFPKYQKEAILYGLASEDMIFRKEAEALAFSWGQKGLPFFKKAASGKGLPGKIAYVQALGRFGLYRNAVFQKALSSPIYPLFTKAVYSLQRAETSKALAALKPLLKDPVMWRRRVAVQALGRIGGKAIPSLLQALKDPSVEVKETAIKQLRYTRSGIRALFPKLDTLLQSSLMNIRYEAGHTCWMILGFSDWVGPELLGQLLKKLLHPSYAVRSKMVEILTMYHFPLDELGGLFSFFEE